MSPPTLDVARKTSRPAAIHRPTHSGQPGRETHDIDVWGPTSTCAETDLRRACAAMGVEVYVDAEKHSPDRDSYIQVIDHGVSVRIMDRAYAHVTKPGSAVALPDEFPVLVLGELGRLFVLSPEPALLVALKLARGKEQDMADAAWWVAALVEPRPGHGGDRDAADVGEGRREAPGPAALTGGLAPSRRGQVDRQHPWRRPGRL